MNPDIANLGGILSPSDERDFKLSEVGAGTGTATVDTFLPDYSNLPVYNQIVGTGGQTACGGCSGAKLQNILLGYEGDLSWRFVYAMCKKIDGLPPESGTYGRAIMQVLQKYGVPRADLFPNDTSLSIKDFADYTKIPQAAFVDALSRRIGPYALVDDLSPLGLRSAIQNHKAVLVLKSPWQPSSWYNVPSNCGHFFELNGFLPVKIRFPNSFGKDWGADANGGGNGDGYLLDSDLATIKEAWVAYEPAPTPEPTVVVPEPTPIPQDPEQRRLWIIERLIVLKTALLSFFK